jgi:hypothetical protein
MNIDCIAYPVHFGKQRLRVRLNKHVVTVQYRKLENKITLIGHKNKTNASAARIFFKVTP